MTLQRRPVLQIGAAAGLAALAGCTDLLSRGQSSDPDEDPAGWPQFRGGPQRRGIRASDEGPGEEISQAWHWTADDARALIAQTADDFNEPDDVGPISISSPVVQDGTVVVEVEHGVQPEPSLAAIDATNGESLWARTYDDLDPEIRLSAVSLGACLRDGLAYHVTPDGEEGVLYALSLDSGETEWTLDVGPGGPVLRDDTIYVVGDGSITAVDADSGGIDWEKTDVSLSVHRATVTESTIYATDGLDVVGFDRDDGEERVSTPLGDPDHLDEDLPPYASPVIDDGLAVAARSKLIAPLRIPVGIVAFEPDANEPSWGHGPPSEPPTDDGEEFYGYPVILDGLVAVTGQNGRLAEEAGLDPEEIYLFAFDADSGEIEWAVPSRPTMVPVVAGDVIYTANSDEVLAVSTDGEELVRVETAVKTNFGLRSPALADGRLYVPGMLDEGLVVFGS